MAESNVSAKKGRPAPAEELSTGLWQRLAVAEALIELAALHLAAGDRPRALAALVAAAEAIGCGEEEGLAAYDAAGKGER